MWIPARTKLFHLCRSTISLSTSSLRGYSVMASQQKGLVLGLYEGDSVNFTTTGQTFLSKCSQLEQMINVSGLLKKKGKSRVFYGVVPEYAGVAVVSLGKKEAAYNEQEQIEENRENVRIAVGAGVKELHDAGMTEVEVDPCGDAEAAAEGAVLSTWSYTELKTGDKKKTPPKLALTSMASDQASAWERGVVLAEGQNLARLLMETPANHMTPTRFAEIAQNVIGKVPNVQVTVRDRAWAESMKMGSYLSVTNGSEEPPKFVEINYTGGKSGDAPFALVGKGITFDSGGISIKPSAGMDSMRADMGGAACVVSSLYTAARLKVPHNIMAFVPLCENMPSGKATKPGDVVYAMNGKSIQVDNTDAEGRLVLADALLYAQTFKPTGIIDMATLTGAMGVALGSAAAGVFSNDTKLWDRLHKAGTVTGDRVWRMPLLKHYTKQVTEQCPLADVINSGINTFGRGGGASTAAAFLWEFVEHKSWAHIDIAGVMSNKGEVPYLCKGMAGRPTRTIAHFLENLSK